MSGGGGTSTTYTNATPYNSTQLLDYMNGAVQARQDNPIEYTPYQTYSPPPDNTWTNLSNAQSDYGNAGNLTGNQVGNAQYNSINANDRLVTGGAYTDVTPWNNSLTALGDYNPAWQNINNLQTGAGTNQLNSNAAGTGPGGTQLTDTASGKYLGSNPTLDATYTAASDPLVSAYQTATSPNTDSAFAAAGRYNSGANQNATLNNETALGKSLADLSADIYGKDYENERGREVTAGNDLGTISNTAATGANTAYNNAGNLNVSGANSQQSALNSGISNYGKFTGIQQSAIAATPTQTAMPYTDYSNAYNSGLNTQTLNQKSIDDQNKRFYGVEYSPWTTLGQEAGIIGGAVPGSSTSTYPTSSSTGGSILGGIGSGLGVANGLNTLTSGSGMLSAASLAAK